MSDKNSSNVKKPEIVYCSECVYPSSYPSILSFDENSVCSGCLVSKEKFKLDYKNREKELVKLFEENRKKSNSHYDCIIPVSGGKDSHFQAHTVKRLGFNALLVTYNGNNYSKTGLRNLQNMRDKFGFDHVFYTPSVKTLIKLNKLGMLIMGDMNWHNHMGIFTYPIKVAVEKNIPLMIWGEHGKTDLGGMFSYNDYIEFSFRERVEHDGRGYDWHNIVEISEKYNEKLTKKDMYAWIYPSDDQIDQVGVRGIFLSNYVFWEANDHLKLMKEKYDFKEDEIGFERTYRKGSNLDDIYENGAHDYLKFIKFGFGRSTDHACKDIRARLMTRETAIQEVKKRDHIKSKDIKIWLKYVGWSEKKFDQIADSFRDPRVWWIKNNEWWKNNVWGNSSSYGKVHLEKKYWNKYYIES